MSPAASARAGRSSLDLASAWPCGDPCRRPSPREPRACAPLTPDETFCAGDPIEMGTPGCVPEDSRYEIRPFNAFCRCSRGTAGGRRSGAG
jgi:hypothetical protein